jgi:hypothetical protein
MNSLTTTSAVATRYFIALLVLLILGPAAWAGDPVRIAVFQGEGVGVSSVKLIAALENAKNRDFAILRITADEVRDGKLSNVDVLVHPGGSGSKQGEALGEEGRKAVREFVRDGGGFLGVCAGAYLATNDYSWSLNLIDAKVVDRRHWARGNGTVKIRLAPTASTFFGLDRDTLEIHYAQGPLLARREWDDEDVPDYQSLAIFDSEIAENGAPRGVMQGTSAVVRARYAAGRVFCFSPHPELTEGLEHLIPVAANWLVPISKRQAIEEPCSCRNRNAKEVTER